MSPLAFTSAGHAMGSTVARVTRRSPSCAAYSVARVSGAVAEGTISLSATQSPSCERPSNGRRTSASPAVASSRPWQAL